MRASHRIGSRPASRQLGDMRFGVAFHRSRVSPATRPLTVTFAAAIRVGAYGLEDVTGCAGQHGLRLDCVTDMPANNLSVVFPKTSG